MTVIRYHSSGVVIDSGDGKDVDVAAVYSPQFVEQLNEAADEAAWSSDYINEIFMYFFLRIKECTDILMVRECAELNATSVNGKNWFVWMAAALKLKVKVPLNIKVAFQLKNVGFFLYSFLVVLVTSLMLPLYVLTRKRKPIQSLKRPFTVIRSPATYNKMSFLGEQVEFFYDDLGKNRPSNNGLSLYGVGSVTYRLSSLFRVPFLAIKDYILIARDSKRLLGWQFTGYVLNYYSKRIAHKSIFEYYLELLIKENKNSLFYTGNKEDRFAVLENRLSDRLNVNLICIPHGIEYSYRVPAGLAGKKFYCSTRYVQMYLRTLYKDKEKFIFDDEIANKMFDKGYHSDNAKRLVFFPESREPEINASILKCLIESGRPVFLKLHILDKVENYTPYLDKITLIDNFDDAITNNICVARKSTVLIEAIYNGSLPVAVLINSKDKAFVDYMLPSLKDQKIRKIDSCEQLSLFLSELTL